MVRQDEPERISELAPSGRDRQDCGIRAGNEDRRPIQPPAQPDERVDEGLTPERRPDDLDR